MNTRVHAKAFWCNGLCRKGQARVVKEVCIGSPTKRRSEGRALARFSRGCKSGCSKRDEARSSSCKLRLVWRCSVRDGKRDYGNEEGKGILEGEGEKRNLEGFWSWAGLLNQNREPEEGWRAFLSIS